MQESITIQKNPALAQSSDYELLRSKGLDYIQQLGSQIWTDYNIHDPGITMLELLSYAITDLGYRTSFDIKDILAEKPTVLPDNKRQAFYTAKEILTVNPWTSNDFRKLLIDVVGVKNAWLRCKECACDDLYLYANCKKSELQYKPTEHTIIVKGLYDVMIEFEDDEGSGDLNSGKINYNFSFEAKPGKVSTATIEMRLPSFHNLQIDKPSLKELISKNSEIKKVTVQFISGNRLDNVDVPANELGNVLRKPLYATLTVTYKPDAALPATKDQQLIDIPLNVWFDNDADRKSIQLSAIKTAIEDASGGGIIAKYVAKIKKAAAVIEKAKNVLHAHRNLCEDYCTISAVQTQDIAVCADMEVDPAVDIEEVMANALYQIDQYFSEDIKFYSLKELLNQGKAVEDIFDGPALENGFIDNDQLAATNLKKVLYTSDVINLLMDIPGVKAVKNFALARYDEDGRLVESQPWSIKIADLHQPRLYIEGSKFLVFKNDLPFLPDKSELINTLQVIKGRNAQPKFTIDENDLPVQKGNYFKLSDYYPLQYSLPQTYGVGYHGLPDTASTERKAQAKQLKAYLLFYEQLLVNYLEQLSHTKDLFAIDVNVTQTYFSRKIGTDEIAGIGELYTGLNAKVLHELDENKTVFADRRNRFLNHMLARFSENFNEYALMLYSFTSSKAVADSELIKDKIAFLQDYPFMSSNRGRSFNYKEPAAVCSPENIAGIVSRIRRQLGFDDFSSFFHFVETSNASGEFVSRSWVLKDHHGFVYLNGLTLFTDDQVSVTQKKAAVEFDAVKNCITDAARYLIKKKGKFTLTLNNAANNPIAVSDELFETKEAAEAARDKIISFATGIIAANKIQIVEHLLLRPRNKPGGIFPAGDPLLSICIEPDCSLCGEEDPYSFRLTVVLNGEEGIANSNLEFRRFAEQTIRMEIPAHLGVKICWVSTAQQSVFEILYCSWLETLAQHEPDALTLHNKLISLLKEFLDLKSVYPQATLHDCVDGDDGNRVFLNQTII